ncbi:FAD-binding oxidoreductase [Gloeothece verrucosa]|uniref:FAD linked oxidase domain protein n=1 Tax=Gloeothece verrucosa (strain PCC 7822) TaxID=497965 RepID=E0UJS7_GLOV7|nr:FAD-binding oxidoreductase [Gloeothece verrucosa]ADN13438.1 FAD linked oxidase domain protein [Gloeothece verrucosa PCC 7822]
MTTANTEDAAKQIAAKLETLLDSQTEIIPWEQVDYHWKQKIESAIASDTPPSYLIYPHTQETLAQIIQTANEQRWAVLPCGSGSKLNWGGLVKNPQLVISTARLNRIIEQATGDLTVTVEAGVKLADLQQTLKQHNQFLPVDPAYPEAATLGGIVATSDTGNWRQGYGGVKDLVLGLSIVRTDGKIAKAGGRVVKNVAGYDMMRLFSGSYSTLGVICQLTFKVYPLLESSQTVVLTGDANGIEKATATIRMSSLTPTAADVLSSGMVHQLGIGKGIGLILRFQGIPESITQQSNQVKMIGQELGLIDSIYREDEENPLWKRLQELITISQTESSVTAKIGIIPTQMISFIRQLDQLTDEQGLGMINLGSGLGSLLLESEAVLSQLSKLRSLLETGQGFLTVLTAPKPIKQQFEPWGYRGNALDLMRNLKQKFDPNNILSPGRFVGGL